MVAPLVAIYRLIKWSVNLIPSLRAGTAAGAYGIPSLFPRCSDSETVTVFVVLLLIAVGVVPVLSL
jgi:hypothetical protein